MARYRSNPKEVEAFQWREATKDDAGNNPGGVVKHGYIDFERVGFYVVTIHEQITPVKDGDWIVTEPDGEHHYPIKPEIFEKGYTEIDKDSVATA